MARQLDMDDCEIRRRHKWGCSIEILAELNACHQIAIRRILGEDVDMPKLDWDKAKELYDQGKNDREIAEALGCSAGNVFVWRDKQDLPANGRHKKLIASEETTAGAIKQTVAETKPTKSTKTSADTRPVKHTTCTKVAKKPADVFDSYQDDIDDLLHELYRETECFKEYLGGQRNADEIKDYHFERLQLENKILIAMLLGAGVTNVREKLAEVIG